jgi:CheY-like chemotaxis protein
VVKVLVVDDDPRDLHALHMLVGSCEGMQIELAGSGPEALLLADLFQPDLVILDFKMPGMSGSETAAYLRKVIPQAHVVAVSAHIDGGADWADGFIRKDHLQELPAVVDMFAKNVVAGSD